MVGGTEAFAVEKPVPPNNKPNMKTTADARNARRPAKCCVVCWFTNYKLVNRQALNESATLEDRVSLFHPRSNGFGGVFGSEVHGLGNTFIVECFFKSDIH